MTANVFAAFAPKITRMIRADHANLLAVFHRYTADAPTSMRQALADRICVALEIHLKLEEEVFYPALRELYPEGEVILKSEPEHNDIRRLVARLRRMSADDIGFDGAVLDLMRHFMHHVADEETVLLPAAERVLTDHLAELGGRMSKRRFELARPRAGEIVSGLVRSTPPSTALMLAGAVGVGLLAAMLVGRSEERD
jgi:hemerythrin-like domain-containing protein